MRVLLGDNGPGRLQQRCCVDCLVGLYDLLSLMSLEFVLGVDMGGGRDVVSLCRLRRCQEWVVARWLQRWVASE